MRIDVHTHYVPPLPDFADRYGDPRWPSFRVDGNVGQLTRDAVVVRSVPPSSWNLAARLEEMDRSGTDVHVLSPLPPVICDWAGPEAAVAWCDSLNEGIAAAVAAHPARFRGLGTVPVQHPELAIEVLRRAASLDLAGVEIGTTAGARELDHPELREFFAAAAELGMLVYVHPLILGAKAGWTDRIDGLAPAFGLGMTTDTALAAAKLFFGGVAARFPRLRVCLSHGGGTFAWALPRIAKAWDSPDGQPEYSAAQLTANLYVDTVVYRPESVLYLTQILGAQRVLFGTDYPLPAADDLSGATLAGLSMAERELVEGRNAAGLLGLTMRAQA